MTSDRYRAKGAFNLVEEIDMKQISVIPTNSNVFHLGPSTDNCSPRLYQSGSLLYPQHLAWLQKGAHPINTCIMNACPGGL